MRTLMCICIALTCCQIMSAGFKLDSSSRGQSDQPIACALDALNEQQARRHAELIEEIGSSVQAVNELADGYEFRFPATMLESLAEFISLERRCCSFMTFELILAGGDESIAMRLRGSEEIKAFVRAQVLGRFR